KNKYEATNILINFYAHKCVTLTAHMSLNLDTIKLFLEKGIILDGMENISYYNQKIKDYVKTFIKKYEVIQNNYKKLIGEIRSNDVMMRIKFGSGSLIEQICK